MGIKMGIIVIGELHEHTLYATVGIKWIPLLCIIKL